MLIAGYFLTHSINFSSSIVRNLNFVITVHYNS